jgi:hypothetical protein
MDANILAAIISAAGSAAVAITALILNHRGFAAVDSRFSTIENRISDLGNRQTAIENRMTAMENRLDRRLENIEAGLKEFFRVLAEHDKRIQRFKDKQ